MDNKITVFQRKRKLALGGLLLIALGIILLFMNNQFELFPHNINWGFTVIAIVAGIFTILRYRCPYCGKFPETDDVPMFNPEKCDYCGGKLK